MKLNKEDLIGWIGKAGKTEQIKEFQYPYLKGMQFYVNIAHASRFVLNQIRQLAAEEFTDRRTRIKEEKLNEEQLHLGYAERIVKGWRGLTGYGLNELIPGMLDAAEEHFKEEKKKNPDLKIPTRKELGDAEAEYSIDTTVEIFANSVDFLGWIIDMCGNTDHYSKVGAKKKKQYENLKQ